MSILMNRRMAAALISLPAGAFGAAGDSIRSIWLCSGPEPADAQLDVLTVSNFSSQSVITNNKVVAIDNLSSIGKQVGEPSIIYHDVSGFKGTSLKAGVLTWALIKTNLGVAIADVGLPNSGAIVQVDRVVVETGNVVNLLSLTMRVRRP